MVHGAVWGTPAVLLIEIGACAVGIGALWQATRPHRLAPPRARAIRATMALTFAGMTMVVLLAHALRSIEGIT